MRPLPPQCLEVFLQPGEYCFGGRDTRIRTVLGSCVSLTFWHSQLLLGAMCHYMLPSRDAVHGRHHHTHGQDGRYADEVMKMMVLKMDGIGTQPKEYEVKLFGGGNMFPTTHKTGRHVGQRNVEVAKQLVNKYGFTLSAEHFGGAGHRNIVFDVWNGDVWVKHQDVARSGHVAANLVVVKE